MKFVNEGWFDRVLRGAVGALLLYLGFAGVVTGGWGLFLKIFGFIPLLTGLIGYCPLYSIFKIRTNKA